MANGIIAGGNWIVDRVKIVESWPEQDTLATIIAESWSNGGAPYNVLVDLAVLGAPFPLSAIGLVGKDSDGKRILQDCRARKIETKQLLETDAAPTSYTDVITVRSTGRRTFFHNRGANALLGREAFDFSNTDAKIFHYGYLLLLDQLDAIHQGKPRVCEVLRAARAKGLITSIDLVSDSAGRFRPIAEHVLPEADILFANDFEAEKLTGIPLRTNGVIRSLAVGQAARQLIRCGVKKWVIIHFPEAAYACDASGTGIWQPSVQLRLEEIHGAAGAGDALAAGVLYGEHENWSMQESLKLGVSVAAMSLRDPSCSGGIKPFQECLNFGNKQGMRALPA